MSAASIVLLIISIVCLIIGLLLSGSGTTNGLTNIIGQDLELFKKTKDRGFIKILQMTMFFLMIVMLVLLILSIELG
ncbi:MAG: preprotein translocase subunit SecG [Mycoplasmoidaceae bacterium]|nr:preprotein translocase subunit SecG [Mycoplasmoidaceae bacterium]